MSARHSKGRPGLIVPSEYFTSGVFQMPHILLKHPALALAWVVLGEERTMTYVSRVQADSWERQGIDWRALANENLKNASAPVVTREFRDEAGALAFAAMMHEDGLGPSRILLSDELQAIFPEGYRIALPQRSVAFAVSNRAPGASLREVESLVAKCFRDGDQPMLEGLHQPDLFTPQAPAARRSP